MIFRGFFFIILQITATLAFAESKVARPTDSPFSEKWLNLVHYKEREDGTYHGEADGLDFYVSPNGRNHPDLEWSATLEGFKRPIPQKLEDLEKHPRCMFPARFHYLAEIYPEEFKKLPPILCPGFEMFRRSLAARGVSLIFSSYFLNNPSSAFGHTFLRLKHAPEHADTERAELLDYGINYAAVADTSNAFFYGLEGLMGFFPGTFTKLPYYYKVREYNDFESRDIWVYDLNLTQPQVDELVEHLWELGQTYFDYYFLTKNCSYHILRALDAVNPAWHLTDKVMFYVIPSQTVRAVKATPNFVTNISFRPSMRRQFSDRLSKLTSEQTRELEKVTGAETASVLSPRMSVNDKVAVLDAAIDYVDYRYASKVLKGDETKLKLKQQYLVARSELGVPSAERLFPPPEDEAPDGGHSIRRAGLSYGLEDRSGNYLDLNFRAAFHDLLDLPTGYPISAEMSAGDLSLRYYFNDKKLQVQNFALVQITSLSPVDSFSIPISWRFKIGLDRVEDLHCNRCLATGLHLAGGLAKGFFKNDFLAYALIDTQALYSEDFYDHAARFGVGPLVGIRTQIAPKFQGLFEARWIHTPNFNTTWSFDAGGELRYSLKEDHAVGISTHDFPAGWDTKALYYVYF